MRAAEVGVRRRVSGHYVEFHGAEVRGKRSTMRLRYERYAVISTDKACKGQSARHGVDMSGHVPMLDTWALIWRGSQALLRMYSCLTRLPMHAFHTSCGRELSGGWGWVEGISLDRVPRVTEVLLGQDCR